MKKKRFIVSGGGTGGHIYPAIAIAGALKLRFPDADFLFVGAKDRMEMEKVPNAGYQIKGLWISGIKRSLTIKNLLSNLLLPFKLASSLWKSARILKDFQPDIAIGTGGFASGALLRVAAAKGVPTVLQEQNSYPGITNKWLSKNAQTICVAYDNLQRFFPKDKIVKTGNPVRQDLLSVGSKRKEGIAKFKLDPNKKTLLVLGGSLGARNVNRLIVAQLPFLASKEMQLIWQCGSLYHEEYKKYDMEIGVQVHAFLNRMDLAYAAADFIISRAGASSVSELCIVGKPVVFIPSPNVAEDHQTKNAKAIVDKDAAILLIEKDAMTDFEKIVEELVSNTEKQEELSNNIKKLALPNATNQIVAEIEKLLLK